MQHLGLACISKPRFTCQGASLAGLCLRRQAGYTHPDLTDPKRHTGQKSWEAACMLPSSHRGVDCPWGPDSLDFRRPCEHHTGHQVLVLVLGRTLDSCEAGPLKLTPGLRYKRSRALLPSRTKTGSPGTNSVHLASAAIRPGGLVRTPRTSEVALIDKRHVSFYSLQQPTMLGPQTSCTLATKHSLSPRLWVTGLQMRYHLQTGTWVEPPTNSLVEGTPVITHDVNSTTTDKRVQQSMA